ncbi:DUF1326 domain-containing protein [Gloeothece verrucosa]|uniref:DUF1326 domain-containing protein n=1 Tax=Gloeothece verrucosa (strain PCC 7822) TaxID=497965 RepID=E0UIU8_GLOV7|nr:DUF1326 domain-containing protein [Gloeothece verrucosa]ADN13407.1 protein of unknown function DUF1326 [Gloeothece verrucosa PCC 7822]
MTTTTFTYQIDGQILEACSCNTPCPCWIGEDPDGGYCDSFVAYHVEQGTILGIDVSGLTLVKIVYIPGNVLAGNWRAVIYVDAKGTAQQQDALIKVFTGELGGALADLAYLVSETLDVRVAPIEYHIKEAQGTIRIGEILKAEMAPYRSAQGKPTKLVDSIFSTIPGSPAYVAKASYHQVNLPEFNLVWNYNGRNAIQGQFHFEA